MSIELSNILFLLSLALFVIILIVFFLLVRKSLSASRETTRGDGLPFAFFLVKPLPTLAIGIAVVEALLATSEIACGIVETPSPLTQVPLMVLQSFTFSREALPQTPPILSQSLISPNAYYFLDNLVYIVASLTTLGTIAFLVLKTLVVHTLRYASRRADVYVFSRVNTPSLALAHSIAAHYANASETRANEADRCLVLFADTNLEDSHLMDDLKDSGFRYVDMPVSNVIKRCRCGERTTLHVILSSRNEVENLHEGIGITRTLTKAALSRTPSSARRPTIHLFSNSPAAESYVDEMANIASNNNDDALPPVVIRRIDWVRNVMYGLFQSYPLFMTSPLQGGGGPAEEDDIERLYGGSARHLVIVGAGHVGYEFLKGMVWCANFYGVETRIDVVDVNARQIEAWLQSVSPSYVEHPDEFPDIQFHPWDVKSAEYQKFLRESEGSITYMLFSLGDDLLNTETARHTREVLEQTRFLAEGKLRDTSPFIALIVDDPALASSMTRIRNASRQPYDLVPVGDLESVYSFDNVFLPRLEATAKRLNYAYAGLYEPGGDSAQRKEEADVAFESFEYNRRASRASAVFLKYDLYSFCRRIHEDTVEVSAELPSPDAWTKPLDDPAFNSIMRAYTEYVENEANRTWLNELEHRRWLSYMRTEGFVTASEEAYQKFHPLTGKNQHLIARLHACLVPFGELRRVSGMTREIEGVDPRYELNNDRIVHRLVWIAREGE